MSHPKYLKKIGDPDHIYHIWTPFLAERGDMLPFEPPLKADHPINVEELGQAIASSGRSLSQAAREIGMDKGRLSRLLSGQVTKLRPQNTEKINDWLKNNAVEVRNGKL